MRRKRSTELFERAKKLIPGGVNSPVRAYKAVGGEPIFIARGKGPRVWDVDDNEYVDYVGSWGPLILGHANEEVLEAVIAAARKGTTFGAPTELEVQFAEAVQKAFPSMHKLRAVSSGTEAAMSALRVARGFTKRDKIVKVDGGYHGHADFLLSDAGSGVATLGIPGSAGVPKSVASDTLTVPYNDVAAMKAVFAANPKQIAAVIIEPVAGNMGVVAPLGDYLGRLKDLCHANGSLLIFDEVITGFRVAYGGAQDLYRVTPDMTVLGKIVGGGLPAACYGGRAEIMEVVAPLGPVYQAGTLSGNPLAMAAGIKTMELLGRDGVYTRLEASAKRLTESIHTILSAARIPHTTNRVGSMWTTFFSESPVTDYASAKKADVARFGKLFRRLTHEGILVAPSQFEAGFVSLSHADADLDFTIHAWQKVVDQGI